MTRVVVTVRDTQKLLSSTLRWDEEDFILEGLQENAVEQLNLLLRVLEKAKQNMEGRTLTSDHIASIERMLSAKIDDDQIKKILALSPDHIELTRRTMMPILSGNPLLNRLLLQRVLLSEGNDLSQEDFGDVVLSFLRNAGFTDPYDVYNTLTTIARQLPTVWTETDFKVKEPNGKSFHELEELFQQGILQRTLDRSGYQIDPVLVELF